MTLLVDVNCPGSQEDLVSNWKPARSLVGDAVSGAEFAPCLPAAESPSGARNPPRILIMPGLLNPLEKVSRMKHLSLFEWAPAAYVSGANFLS